MKRFALQENTSPTRKRASEGMNKLFSLPRLRIGLVFVSLRHFFVQSRSGLTRRF
jgi:hypothetical protein